MRGIPSVAGIGPGATRLGEESAPIFSLAASVIEAARPVCSTHGPPRFDSNATEFPPVEKTDHAGRASSTTPTTNFLRKLLARSALSL